MSFNGFPSIASVKELLRDKKARKGSDSRNRVMPHKVERKDVFETETVLGMRTPSPDDLDDSGGATSPRPRKNTTCEGAEKRSAQESELPAPPDGASVTVNPRGLQPPTSSAAAVVQTHKDVPHVSVLQVYQQRDVKKKELKRLLRESNGKQQTTPKAETDSCAAEKAHREGTAGRGDARLSSALPLPTTKKNAEASPTARRVECSPGHGNNNDSSDVPVMNPGSAVEATTLVADPLKGVHSAETAPSVLGSRSRLRSPSSALTAEQQGSKELAKRGPDREHIVDEVKQTKRRVESERRQLLEQRRWELYAWNASLREELEAATTLRNGAMSSV
jgi:hypothetical protein